MKVLVTDPVADAGLDALREAGHDVETAYDVDGRALLDAVADAEALVVGEDTDVSRQVFAAAPNLRVVVRAGIDVDNIDLDAAVDHGVVVANAPEGVVRTAAEHTIAMLLATGRDIPQSHARLRAGEWAKSDFLGTEINGKTLGVVGLGRVGREVAHRLSELRMDVVANDPYVDQEDVPGIELVDLEECLARADFLSIHTPLTPETEGLVGEDELVQMAGGHVVSTARNGVVNEDALAAAVRDGTLKGAAVDIYDQDELAENPLLSVDDVVVTPHLTAADDAAADHVSASVADQVLSAARDEPVGNAVNAPTIDESAYPRLRSYVTLAETAGKIAAGIFDGDVTDVAVGYEGDIAGEEVEYLTASALTGVFEDHEDVNVVNAGRVAEERGVAVHEARTRESEHFQNLLSVQVGDGDASVEVCGTLFAGDDPRIVLIDGYRVDAIPHGQMLVTRNRDVPGVIGFIGSVLGENGVNIAGMFNGRESRGGDALTVYNLDQPVPGDVLATLRDDSRITDVNFIELNGLGTSRIHR